MQSEQFLQTSGNRGVYSCGSSTSHQISSTHGTDHQNHSRLETQFLNYCTVYKDGFVVDVLILSFKNLYLIYRRELVWGSSCTIFG